MVAIELSQEIEILAYAASAADAAGVADAADAAGVADAADAADAADEWADASCRDGTGELAELFFSDDIADIIRAKRICSGCPVAAACLEGARERREPWGVWGGELFLNGRILAQKRKRGRPPKNPPAGIQLTA